MASYNKVILVGNLTRDPELRYTPKGTAIAKIGLAINRYFTTETGEKKEEVTFVDVDIFGRTAENVGQYMRKGRPILVEGRLRLDQWDDKPARNAAAWVLLRKLCNSSAVPPAMKEALLPRAQPGLPLPPLPLNRWKAMRRLKAMTCHFNLF